MGDTAFQKIEALAYQIWLDEGCPHGRAEAHWFEAQNRILSEASPPGVTVQLHANRTLRGRRLMPSAVTVQQDRNVSAGDRRAVA
jgi:hypothetical protein